MSAVPTTGFKFKRPKGKVQIIIHKDKIGWSKISVLQEGMDDFSGLVHPYQRQNKKHGRSTNSSQALKSLTLLSEMNTPMLGRMLENDPPKIMPRILIGLSRIPKTYNHMQGLFFSFFRLTLWGGRSYYPFSLGFVFNRSQGSLCGFSSQQGF